MKTNRTLGVVSVLTSAAFFGVLPVMTRAILEGGSSTLFTSFLRFFLSLLPLYIYLKITKVDMKIEKEDIRDILIVTVFGYAGTTMLLFGSYNFIPSGLATTIHFLYPTFTVAGSIIFLKVKPDRRKILCVILSLIGILLFYSKGESGNSMTGMALAFLSGITYAFYTVFMGRSRIRNMPALKAIFYMNIVGSLMYLILSVSFGKVTLDIPGRIWLISFIASVCTTFIGVFGYQIGVKHIGSENTAILSTFEPIMSIIMGYIVYSESFSLKEVIGIIFILLSTVIVAGNRD